MSSSYLKPDPVRTYFSPIERITAKDIQEMYALYEAFYEKTSLSIFLNDLSKKSGVIVLRSKVSGQIAGFSTQTFFNIVVDGKRVRGIFSGDTIIDPAYWGNNSLVTTFYRRLIIERFKHPFTPFYWFLISKGYKTFLLLTNNFYEYYPRATREDARLKRITEAYCQQLFGDYFDPQRMLLDFGHDYVRLKSDVARITPELAQADRDIAFFEKINPTWEVGTEVPCIGVFNYTTLLRSMYDIPAKWIRKRILRTHYRPGTELDPALTKQKQGAARPPQSQAKVGSGDGAWLDEDASAFTHNGAN